MPFNQDAKQLIDKCVRRLVLAMKSIEADGIEDRERIEEYVILSMQRAEYLYYGLSGENLDAILNFEKRNDKARKEFYTMVEREWTK